MDRTPPFALILWFQLSMEIGCFEVAVSPSSGPDLVELLLLSASFSERINARSRAFGRPFFVERVPRKFLVQVADELGAREFRDVLKV